MLNVVKFLLLMVIVLFLGCSEVKVKKQSVNKYKLIASVNSATDIYTASLSDKAYEVCPIGYKILSQSYTSNEVLQYSERPCIVDGCSSKVEWYIHCSHGGQEPFSLFGGF